MSEEYRVFRELADYFLKLAPQVESLDYTVNHLLKRIRDAVDHGYLYDVLISGGQGTGKSTLALYTMYRWYNKDPGKVLENVFFRVEDLQQVLLREKRQVVLLDDAGVTLSKYRFMTEEAVQYVLLQQIARTRVNAILYTTVYDNIIKHLRDIVDTVVALHTRKGSTVYGSVYSKKTKYYTVVKKLFDFEIHFEEVHQDQAFHQLYTEYNRRREDFITSVMKELALTTTPPAVATTPRKTREEQEEEEAEKLFEKHLGLQAKT